MLIPVILSGGSGTRLWPLSRELYPKQLLPLVGERTMMQDTALRLAGLEGIGAPIVVCNEHHRFMVAEQLRQVGVEPAAIVLEPVGRNTAPAVAIAAILAGAQEGSDRTGEEGSDPNAAPAGEEGSDPKGVRPPSLRGLTPLGSDPSENLLLVLPADHVIRNVAAFQAAVTAAVPAAQAGQLVTFGVVPTHAETGYGYIRKGQGTGPVVPVAEFVEKPDAARAEAFLASGEYLWNSGMFLFSAGRYLQELAKFAPAMRDSCARALAGAQRDFDFTRLPADVFGECPADSIDYAVMEKTEAAAVIPLDAGWSDVGSWASLQDALERDERRNVHHGDVVSVDSDNCLLFSSGRLVAAVGLKDHVVVETADAVMVAPRDRVQDVKLLVSKLKDMGRSEPGLHREVFRPWGSYDSVDAGERFQVKRLKVKPGAVLSLQLHKHRAEHWIVVSGVAKITRGEETFLLRENESTYIPIGTKHRIENPGDVPVHIIEVQSGRYLGEDDIVRFDDRYGREGRTD